ncbi:MAG: TonB-dependent receptor [Candidatus Didemnitutus sp.]|nr:TonB-dependent receptor [Candidatus Didemnitutus sp.]
MTTKRAAFGRLPFGVWTRLAALPLLAANFAVAQTTTDAASPTDDKVLKLDSYQVTGSYLPAAANSVAIPVISIDRNSIENSGNSSDVLEILRKTAPQFNGNANLGSGNANIGGGSTNGGSQLALRNTNTLVLVNGRRVAYAPVGASGGFQFVDVNLIPVAAVERIEVLADGASAIYGTDAVAGVVNIILRSDYNGFEAGGRYGWATSQGHAAERSAYIVGGVSNGKTSFTMSAEWIKDDPIFAYERPYSAVTFGSPTFAGSVNIGSDFYYLNDSLGAPAVVGGGRSPAALVAAGVYSGPRSAGQQFELFNLSRYVTQKLGNQRHAFTGAFEHKVTDTFSIFGDLLYSNTRTASQINGQPLNIGSVPAGQFGNPFDVAVTPRNRLVDHPRQFFNDTTGIRGVVGLRGQLTPEWKWEAAANYNRITQDYKNPGVINNTNLIAAVEAGAFNLFARNNDPAAYGPFNIVGTASGGFVSTLVNYDAKVTGTLFQVPAGNVDVAVGGEIRREKLTGDADPLSIPDAQGNIGWNGAVSLSPFTADRDVKSIFTEIRVPVLANAPGAHLLELSGALRYEKYSDTSDPTVPKITVRYLPFNDEFALRGTYSKSFTAPTLYNLFGPAGIGFTSAFTLDPHDGSDPIDNYQTNYQSTSNPNLDPAKSRNYTAGFVYSPKNLKGFALSVDYWNIKQTGLIAAYGGARILQSVEDLGTASPYYDRVRIGSFTGAHVTGPGQISAGVPDDIYVTDSLVNLAAVKLDGFDVTAKYRWDTGTWGAFNFQSNVGIYNSYKVSFFPGEDPEETAGHSSNFNGTVPRWQTYTSADYKWNNWGAFLGVRYLPSVTDNEDGAHVGSFYTLDASVSYAFDRSWKYLGGARVTFGVNNAFNRFGPLDPTVNTDANVDVATYGSTGRLLYVDLRYQF